jgi:hypothetical protein
MEFRKLCTFYGVRLTCSVAWTKAFEDCGSVVGVKWSQLENFVVFIIVTSSSNSS